MATDKLLSMLLRHELSPVKTLLLPAKQSIFLEKISILYPTNYFNTAKQIFNTPTYLGFNHYSSYLFTKIFISEREQPHVYIKEVTGIDVTWLPSNA